MHSLISLLDQNGGKGNLVDMEQMLAGIVPLAPVLDAIPTAVIFIKDAKARYLFANRTLVQRCGVKRLDFLLGKTSAEVFPEQLGAAYTEQDERVLRLGIALEEQLELHLFGSREPGWCITHKRPIFNRNEQIIGLVGISSDLQSASDSDPAYQRMAAVDRHIRENFSRPVTMEALTQVAGISTAQLERCCKRIFHLTPRQMIHKVRLEHAHYLLDTGVTITEIAMRCGYADHSAFTRQFKILTGFTPSQYREAIRRKKRPAGMDRKN